VSGVDADANMLARARQDYPSGEWQQARAEDWQPATPPELIYSNAALHWLADHPTLFPRLLQQLAPGGTLAVQMPANFNAPSHALLRQLADSDDWRAQVGDARMGQVLAADDYYRLLAPHASRLDLWQTTYWQALQGDDALVAWMRGTTLVPFLSALPEAQREDFVAAYRALVTSAYPRGTDGVTLFPFTRLFLVATR
jgi:trans-aconitate 2-methyltransferase